MTQQITARIQFLTTNEQKKKLKLYSFYSGKTIGQIMRSLIDKLNPEEINHE